MLLTPIFLPGGRSLMQEADIVKRLHEGDATVGWAGDERLGVYHNGQTDRWELWRMCEDGEMRLIVRSRPGLDTLDSGVLKFLAEHDSMSRRKYDAAQDVLEHNERVYAARDKVEAEQHEALADKLAWALKKDLGHHHGGTRHMQQALPNAPWKS